MAKKSNSRAARGLRLTIAAVGMAVLGAGSPSDAVACPFCKALSPTLCQLREQAAIVALVEMRDRTESGRSRLVAHRVLAGVGRFKNGDTIELALDIVARPGSLLVIFGTGSLEARPAELSWHGVGVDETSYAYFARAPSLKVPPSERLAYFANYLEHADRLVAEDAYFEFGHATFEDVSRAAGSLPFGRMRSWLTDPAIPPERKGFYGVALGLVRGEAERRQCAMLLRKLIDAPEDDFRAGFDGILGGYLLLSGSQGLALIEDRYFANPHSADGDVRHALAALRFAHEYLSGIPLERQHSALRHLLDRPAFAAVAITDLARMCDWSLVERVARLYSEPDYSDLSVRNSIVGYLTACPQPVAREALARLRAIDPRGVTAAEQVLSRTSGLVPLAE